MASEIDLPEILTKVKQEIADLKKISLDDAARQVTLYEQSWIAAANAFKKAKESATATKEELARLEQKANQTKAVFEAATEALGGFAESMRGADRDAQNFKHSIDQVSGIFEKMGQKGHPAISMLGSLADQMKEGGKTAGGLGATLLALGNDFTRGMIDPLGSAEGMVKAFGTTADRLNTIWQHQADLVASVNKNILGFGGSLANAAEPARLFGDSIASISATIGMSKDQVGKWMTAALEIPGMANSIGKSSKVAGAEMQLFGQQILLANVAGMTMQQVMGLTDTMFTKFGKTSVPEVNDSIALFKTLSNATGQPVKNIIDLLGSGSSQFAIFGAKIKDTANILKAFSDGMKGLPIAEVGKLYDTVTSKIATMDMNTQAFVAQMSGMARGASALGGALKMELDMRTPGGGGAERNLERTIQALTSMTGGRVITLQQATQTPALEMQFETQRRLAGQMLGVTGSAQQSRLLEVLQGVQEGGMSNVDATKNVEGLMAEGKSAQEQSVSLLSRIATAVGGLPAIATALGDLAKVPRKDIERAGRASGAAATGTVPRALNMAMMGRAFADAGKQFVGAISPSMSKAFDALVARVSATTAGAQSLRVQQIQRAARSVVPGAPTDIQRPGETQQKLLTAARPSAYGEGDDLLSPPRKQQVFDFTGSQRGQPDGLPPAGYIRQPLTRGPTGDGEVDGTNKGQGPQVEPATPGALVATPFEPESFTIKVVCEQCHHTLAKKQAKSNQELKGDNY